MLSCQGFKELESAGFNAGRRWAEHEPSYLLMLPFHHFHDERHFEGFAKDYGELQSCMHALVISACQQRCYCNVRTACCCSIHTRVCAQDNVGSYGQ